jgi:hypothetical protein
MDYYTTTADSINHNKLPPCLIILFSLKISAAQTEQATLTEKNPSIMWLSSIITFIQYFFNTKLYFKQNL